MTKRPPRPTHVSEYRLRPGCCGSGGGVPASHGKRRARFRIVFCKAPARLSAVRVERPDVRAAERCVHLARCFVQARGFSQVRGHAPHGAPPEETWRCHHEWSDGNIPLHSNMVNKISRWGCGVVVLGALGQLACTVDDRSTTVTPPEGAIGRDDESMPEGTPEEPDDGLPPPDPSPPGPDACEGETCVGLPGVGGSGSTSPALCQLDADELGQCWERLGAGNSFASGGTNYSVVLRVW